MRAIIAWIRQAFALSTSRRAWYERFGVLALLIVGVVGWLSTRDGPIESRILLAAVWLLVFAILLRREVVYFLGPVFFYEILRGARRRIHITRTLYAVILLITLGYTWLVQTQFERYDDNDLQLQARLAGTFFGAFFGVQMLVIGLVTPLSLAGAIAEEKERRTLEFVLATDLRSREIILGKLAARVANLMLVLLAGVPILAMLQFFGGVDPGEVVAAFAVSALTLVSTASLSMLMSALLRRSRDAIVCSFLVILGYLIASGVAQAGLGTQLGNASMVLGSWTLRGDDLIDWFSAGNPVVGLVRLLRQLDSGAAFGDVLRETVRDYALTHGTLALMCLGWAAWRLRPIAIAQSSGGRARKGDRTRKLPDIGSSPVVWKEVFADPGPRLHILLKLMLALIVLASFWPPVEIIADHWDGLIAELTEASSNPKWHGRQAWNFFHEAINAWVRGMSGFVGSLMLLMVTVRASGSVTGERARHTLDELLTSPLENREIIFGKWIGAILGVRLGWWWLGAVFLVGLFTGSLNLGFLLLTVAAWFIYAGFFSALGIWFSVYCRNTFVATAQAGVAALFALFLHWAATGLLCFFPMAMMDARGTSDLAGWLAAVQLGMTPPYTLGLIPYLSVADADRGWVLEPESIKFLIMPFIGLFVFVLAGISLRNAGVAYFARSLGRTDQRKPEKNPPRLESEPTPEAPAP